MFKTIIYYEWDQKLALSPILLGNSIFDYVKKGQLIELDDEKYTGKDEFPWIVNVHNDIVVHICYRTQFPGILGLENIWMKDLDYFHDEIGSVLKKIDRIEDFRGDVLTTVFRDNYIAIACFSRKPFTEAN